MARGGGTFDERLRTTLVWPWPLVGDDYLLTAEWSDPEPVTGAVRIVRIAPLAPGPIPLGLAGVCAAINLGLDVEGGLEEIAAIDAGHTAAVVHLAQALIVYQRNTAPAAAYALRCRPAVTLRFSGLRPRGPDDPGPSVMIRCEECGGLGYSPTRDIRAGEVTGWPPPVQPYGPWIACDECAASGMVETVVRPAAAE